MCIAKASVNRAGPASNFRFCRHPNRTHRSAATKLAELLRDNTDNVVSTLDGWISTSFIAGKDQRQVVIYSQWRDLASVEAMRANPDMAAYFPRIAALAAFDGFAGDVVYTRHA